MNGGSAQPWRVLIADADADARSQLGGLLRGWDCEILEAANGAQALELLEQRSVDAAFVNVDLPVISGSELLHKARELSPLMPFILFKDPKHRNGGR